MGEEGEWRLLDRKPAGMDVSAKLCNGDMTVSIPVSWQLTTTPYKKVFKEEYEKI